MTTHRANQIVEAAVELLKPRVVELGVKVFAHRFLSLDLEADELPAISVNFGDDKRIDTPLNSIDSMLSVETSAIVVGTDEAALRLQLLAFRDAVEQAFFSDRRIGLPEIVIASFYDGVAAPQFETTGEILVGVLTSNWLVRYRLA